MVNTVRTQSDPKDEKRYADKQRDRTEQLHIAGEQVTSAKWLNVISGIGGGIAFLALIALIWYGSISRGQLNEMQTQRRLSVRPFIGLDEGSAAIQTSTLHIDEAGNASLVYIIRAKNYSNSPATNVWADANLVVADDLYTVYEQQGNACGDAVIGKPDIGLILFQGRDRVFTSMPAMTTINSKHLGSRLQAWLAGCIGYRDQFGYLYRTKFMYMLYDDAGQVSTFERPTQRVDISGHFGPVGGSIDAGQVPKYK